MNPRSLELLEYEALRALVGRYVASDLGRRALAAMEPSTDRQRLEEEMADCAEALDFWRAAERGDGPERPRFEGLPEAHPAAARLRIEGASLDALEILALASLLEQAAGVRTTLLVHAARFPRLAREAARLADFRSLARSLAGKILPDGSVADSASVALQRIRRDIERQRRQITESLERFLRAHREDGLLQEEFVTLRNDRFVVPVVPGAKKRVPGVVHGSSGSGHTLFIEPLEVLEQNNDLVRLAEEELREIHRILRELTARLREHAEDILDAIDVLGRLDFLFAKARFGAEFDCAIPRFSPAEAPRLELRQARHPLLEDVLRRQRKRVVPVTLTLEGITRTLLISGPNTGGKTVAMKTAGLLALMAQSALPVPAAEAEFPLFDDVLADIGDNQSIEQSLSSFSAHVARLKELAEAATSASLVLLDEIGRATDPEEGGALAVSLLEEFRHHGCFTFVSTHLLALKVYGANTPGVLNASMGFNDETLEPTFVLRTGAPGKSAGLEIASRLGLPPHLIDRARARMKTAEREINEMLASLERQLHAAQAERDELGQRERALREREERLAKDNERKREQLLGEVARRAETEMKEFERRAQEAIEQALSSPADRKQAEKVLRQVARVKRELREGVESIRGNQPAAAATGEIAAGMRVRLRDVTGPAKVTRVLSSGMIEVEVGLLKMQAARSDVLEVVPAAAGGGAKLPAGVSFQAGPRWDTLTREINVIGKTAEEAHDEVDKFLDTAFLAEVTRVRIVHGHGMGVLKRMVQELLSRHPHVDQHYPAPPSEGGSGATIVELRGG
jgi:DNA mismatch repair protein MutS2